MLPTELLMFRVRGGIVEPKVLKPNPTNTALATQLIALFESHLNDKRWELDEDLKTLEVGAAGLPGHSRSGPFAQQRPQRL